MAAPGSPRRVPMTVTFLRMNSKPSVVPPPQPKGRIAILRATEPPVHFYRYLYDTIGDAYYWVDRRRMNDDDLAKLVQHPQKSAWRAVIPINDSFSCVRST